MKRFTRWLPGLKQRAASSNPGIRYPHTTALSRNEAIHSLASRIKATGHKRELVTKCLELTFDAGAVAHDVDAVCDNLDVSNKSLLDIGSWACWHAPFYLAAGAISIHCVDKYVDVSTKQIRDQHAANRGQFVLSEMPLPLAEFLEEFEGVQISKQDIVEFAKGDQQFDACILLTVSEHLNDPAHAFEAIANCLNPGGEIFLTHGNFYAWQGHHSAPYSPEGYDPSDLAQRQLVDWGHILNKAMFDPRFNELNLIRIHELTAILARHFDAVDVQFMRSPAKIVERLTKEIRLQLAEYYDDELLTDLYRYRGVMRHKEVERANNFEGVFRVSIAADTYQEGYCYLVPIPFGLDPDRYALYENGRRLDKGNSLHDDVRKLGDGRYSIWGHTLYFSTPRNTDPIQTGHIYELRLVV
jgi:SAM-dependent methyltransferase